MTTLVEVLSDDARREAVVADGVVLIDNEVRRKSGLTGMALKTGFKTVKALKPGIIAEALDRLLPEFAPAVDPHYAKARDSGDVKAYFTSHGGAIADSMLVITDGKAERAKNRVIKKAYFRLRPKARDHVVAAMPALSDLVDKHVK